MKKLILACMFVATAASAQNSAIYKAEELENKGRTSEALAVLENALDNPKTTKYAEIYNRAAECCAKLLNPELIKAAQGVPCDTAVFLSSVDKALNYYIKSHEADVKPDEKGRVKSKFVAQNKARVLSMLDYYNYCGVFEYQSGHQDKALEYFQKYIDLPKCPIFSQAETDSIYKSKADAYNQSALNVTVFNYQAKHWDKVRKSAETALSAENPASMRDLYVMKMEAEAAMGDSAAWLNTLTEAVGRMEDPNFAQSLMYYYYQKNDYEDAMRVAVGLTEKNPDSKTAWYLKGCVDLNIKRDFAAARESFEKALALDDDFADAHYNLAVSYTNEVIQKRNNGDFKLGDPSKKKTVREQNDVKIANNKIIDTQIKPYYEKALPHMEKVRELLPDNPKAWASMLQMIYTNLQQKEKAAEMDQYLGGGK